MPWMLITCGGCGHVGDFEGFVSTPVYGELPKNTFQCPACGLAIERRHAPLGRYDGPVELVVVESRL